MAGAADHRGPAGLRIQRGAASRWRMLNRRAYDSEITTGCQNSCPSAVGAGRAGPCARRRGPPRSSAPELLCTGPRGSINAATATTRIWRLRYVPQSRGCKRRTTSADCLLWTRRSSGQAAPTCETQFVDSESRDLSLDEVLIGGREKREIVITDYNAGWPARFEAERARVQRALGVRALRIEHIGSTAVAGLAAKPIIDLLVTVDDPEDDTSTLPALTSIGYELRVREPGHRMFRNPQQDVVHIWGDADPEVTRYLRFRDRLRDSSEDRQAYEQLKRDLARRDWADMNHYAEAKGPLIADILARAHH